ncbi:unnamed protein product [Amoebophrya sp. A25]|nr:unnamed protein product [Amoebophrya sp. A25]|eukprot:GSA25T00011371001.1
MEEEVGLETEEFVWPEVVLDIHKAVDNRHSDGGQGDVEMAGSSSEDGDGEPPRTSQDAADMNPPHRTTVEAVYRCDSSDEASSQEHEQERDGVRSPRSHSRPLQSSNAPVHSKKPTGGFLALSAGSDDEGTSGLDLFSEDEEPWSEAAVKRLMQRTRKKIEDTNSQGKAVAEVYSRYANAAEPGVNQWPSPQTTCASSPSSTLAGSPPHRKRSAPGVSSTGATVDVEEPDGSGSPVCSEEFKEGCHGGGDSKAGAKPEQLLETSGNTKHKFSMQQNRHFICFGRSPVACVLTLLRVRVYALKYTTRE